MCRARSDFNPARGICFLRTLGTGKELMCVDC